MNVDEWDLYGAIYLFQTFKGARSSSSHGLHICLKKMGFEALLKAF